MVAEPKKACSSVRVNARRDGSLSASWTCTALFQSCTTCTGWVPKRCSHSTGQQVFTAMLTGWRNQQLARRLAFATVEQRERMVRAFAAHSQSYPWLLTASWSMSG